MCRPCWRASRKLLSRCERAQHALTRPTDVIVLFTEQRWHRTLQQVLLRVWRNAASHVMIVALQWGQRLMARERAVFVLHIVWMKAFSHWRVQYLRMLMKANYKDQWALDALICNTHWRFGTKWLVCRLIEWWTRTKCSSRHMMSCCPIKSCRFCVCEQFWFCVYAMAYSSQSHHDS